MTGALFIIGFAAGVLGILLLVSAAAGVHWKWGIACGLLPGVSWIAFAMCHWKRAWLPLVSLSGLIIAAVAASITGTT